MRVNAKMERFCWIHIFVAICSLASKLRLVQGSREGKDLVVQVHVPSYVREGERAILKCLYNVDEEHLYTIKWYKGPSEFFRFTPKENPVIKTFPEFGVKVDPSSNSSVLVLQKVDLNMTGVFGCEVTMDYPYYTTAAKTGKMNVIALPENTLIAMERKTVSVGDTFSVNCTSFRSKPVANLTWLLNGLPVHPHYLTPEVRDRYVDNKETISSGLNFVVRQQHFIRGQMTLTCLARIDPDVYSDSLDVVILEHDRPKISSVVDNYSSFPSGGKSDNRISSSGSLLLTTSAAVPLAQFFLTLTSTAESSLWSCLFLRFRQFLSSSF